MAAAAAIVGARCKAALVVLQETEQQPAGPRARRSVCAIEAPAAFVSSGMVGPDPDPAAVTPLPLSIAVWSDLTKKNPNIFNKKILATKT